MGAVFNDKAYPGSMTKDEVRTAFSALQDQCRYENGHSYSGGFGMATGLQFDRGTFDSEDAARDYLTEHCQKWETARAVRFTGPDGEAWLIGAWCSA